MRRSQYSCGFQRMLLYRRRLAKVEGAESLTRISKILRPTDTFLHGYLWDYWNCVVPLVTIL
jgi:hypothetical protein